jgi:PKHD-type hydroxylase
MLIDIPKVLDSNTLVAIRSVLQQGHFVDGKLSAGATASNHKKNQELTSDDEDRYEALNNVVMTALVKHPLYLQAASPAKISLPIYARYASGMEYGEHIDDPIMGGPHSLYRADIAITVFLNSPEEYDGGELRINTPFGTQEVKLPAGHVIIYPASSVHSVSPVTSGERLVAIAWVQSLIRNPEQRQILFQLAEARKLLEDGKHGKAFQQIDNSYTNLFRMWAEL